MFGVKMESAAVCRGCLSTDRKLSPLTNNKTYFNLLTDQQKQEGLTESEVLLCWECTAALKRMQLFQAQAQKAHVVLELSLGKAVSVRPLSTLTTCHKHSYDAIIHEIEDEEKPIKKEKLSVESGDETYEEDYNDIENSDHLEADAELNFEDVTMPDEFKPLSILKNNQKIEKIENDTINTKIKIRLVESETKKNTRHTVMKRPPSSRIEKIVRKKVMAEKRLVRNKMMAENWLNKNKCQEVKIKVVHQDLAITSEEKTLKRATNPVQFREGIRKSKRLSGIEVEETGNSNECYAETSTTVGLIKVDNANASDNEIGGSNYVNPSNLNDNGMDYEEVKVNKTENVSGNGSRDDIHTDGMDDESLEAASDEVSEQAEENEEDNYEINPKDFRRTIVEYDYHVEFDTYFTKVELSEDETKAALEREPRYVTKELPYDCCYCGLCFQLNRTMERHQRERHQQHRKDIKHVGLSAYYRDSMYRCNHCLVVMRKHKTAAHMKYAHRIRYRCKHCDMDLWKKLDCKQHMITNHSRFDCDLCAETRPSLKLLERHKRHQHKVRKPKSVKNPIQCEECGKKLSHNYELIAHQEKKHPREGSDPRFHCAPCKRTMPSEQHYSWHMKHAKGHRSPVKNQRILCVFCGEERSSKSIQAHYVRFHNHKSDFQCKTCGKYFSAQHRLRVHVNSVHLKVPWPKNKLCTICGRGFSSNRILKHHIRTHTGERPFKCALCPAAFAQPWPLKKHTETQHERRATRDTEHNATRHTQSEAHSQSLHEVSVESRSQSEEITEWQVQDEVIVEWQNQDG